MLLGRTRGHLLWRSPGRTLLSGSLLGAAFAGRSSRDDGVDRRERLAADHVRRSADGLCPDAPAAAPTAAPIAACQFSPTGAWALPTNQRLLTSPGPYLILLGPWSLQRHCSYVDARARHEQCPLHSLHCSQTRARVFLSQKTPDGPQNKLRVLASLRCCFESSVATSFQKYWRPKGQRDSRDWVLQMLMAV